ncbi:protein of unassigned function [Methylobacterium oryzae CBMB20]|uniref:Protein of unassigned function n=1 Tax=Methylobacterium oryzae CBMB20 TaxID=693986 RepID=A0A089P5H8_9HYPH|nr:protein of unassigned function [Methylobacterium oryzae CBMB20]
MRAAFHRRGDPDLSWGDHGADGRPAATVNDWFTQSANLHRPPRSGCDRPAFYGQFHRRRAAMLILNPLTGQTVEVRVPRPKPKAA